MVEVEGEASSDFFPFDPGLPFPLDLLLLLSVEFFGLTLGFFDVVLGDAFVDEGGEATLGIADNLLIDFVDGITEVVGYRFVPIYDSFDPVKNTLLTSTLPRLSPNVLSGHAGFGGEVIEHHY